MVAKKRKQRESATNGKQINATDSMLPLTTTTTSTKTAKKNQNPVKSKSSQKTNIVSNFTVSSSGKKFLMPQDGAEFDKLLKEKYQGFVHIPASQLTPRDFHQRSRAALERLRDANYYQYDVIMAGGKHSSRTFVKRTLVGDPGITYKYLGLRLFAHAWSGPGVVPPVLKEIGDMNQRMMEMTKHQGGKYSDYNLTLINYMEPSSHTKIGFKDEPQYGM
jgi:alpha-ketoglutarate-dependent dioxygenase FTO